MDVYEYKNTYHKSELRFTKSETLSSRLCIMGVMRTLRRVHRRLCLFTILLVSAFFLYILIPHRRVTINFHVGDTTQAQFITAAREQACVQPKLQLYPDLKFRQFFWKVNKDPCGVEPNWIFVQNGTLRFAQTALSHHGYITCDYIPLHRKDEFNTVEGTRIRAIQHGAKITTDFFKMVCFGKSSKHYENYHAGIAPIPQAEKVIPKPEKNSLDLNVMMWGFDSVSRLTWMRKLPKSYDYLVRTLGSVVLEGYNIVGDGTPQALLPILCGKTEAELPEARRGHPGSATVDGHPWIWKDMKKAGYVTQWVEDGVRYGTFTYRMLGFKDQPTDHYMRTFYLEADKTYHKYKPYCLGSQHRHNVMMNWVRDLFHGYPNRRKFSFGFHAECSHDGNNPLSMVDDDLVKFLQGLNDGGHLNQTLLIVMSDHGARFQGLRETVQGKYEERNPFFSLRLPPWFEDQHPKIAKNLRINAKRLTTPFDIHETFKDILSFRTDGLGDINNRGISLFSEIPRERTCEHANIEPHWCTCLSWKQISTSDPIVQRAARHFVFHINRLNAQSTDLCQPLSLNSVSRSVVYSPNVNMLKFKQSADHDGRIPDLSDKTKPEVTLYQLTVSTTPGDGHFELTVRHSLADDQLSLSEHEISRTNKYGNAPNCVAHLYPHLRPYCLCQDAKS